MKIENRIHESGFRTIGPELSTVGRAVILINPVGREWSSGRFVLHFGAYGWTRLMVNANHLQDALDECIDWIAEHAPGLLCNDEVNEEYARLVAAGETEEKAMEIAEADTTSGGNCGDRILSYEWGIALENPSRSDLITYLGEV